MTSVMHDRAEWMRNAQVLIYQIIGCGSVLGIHLTSFISFSVDGIHLTHSCPNVFTLGHRLLCSFREQWDLIINIFQYYVDRGFGRKLLSSVVLCENEKT